MTFDEFKEKKKILKLTHKDFANLIGYSESSIKAWRMKGVPKWVDIVIEHLIILDDLNKKSCKYRNYL